MDLSTWVGRDVREGWPIRYRAGQDIPRSEIYPHHRIVVTAGLHKLRGNERPYWSFTADVINTRKRGDNATEEGGMLHDKISEHFPALAPLLPLHLSDDQGVPMHHYENGRYWLGLTRWATWERTYGKPEPLPAVDVLARHLRISASDAQAMSERYPVGDRGYRPALPFEIEAMRERWQAESDACAQALVSLGAEIASPW